MEHTFGCLTDSRRLSKDYELLPEVSEAMYLYSHNSINAPAIGKNPSLAQQLV